MNRYSKSNISDNTLEKVEHEVSMGHNAWDCVDPKEIIAAAWNVMDKSQENRTKLLCDDWAEDHTYMQNLCRRLGYTEDQVTTDGHDGMVTIQQLADMIFTGPQKVIT